jgi:D-alanyl-lipoteichoic acid acyltransferase DltB (MBOAT superfamily)
MLFNSLEFILVFLPLSLLAFRLARHYDTSAGVAVLVLCSLVFYGWWNWGYLLLMVGSIAINYLLAARIQGARIDQSPWASRWLVLGVAANLGLLAYYKYTNFILDSLFALGLAPESYVVIALPLAISFFTFQQIAFLVDTWRGETDVGEQSLVSYSAFVAFFPQLVAGPIVRHRELVPQLFQRRPLQELHKYFVLGLCLFSLGLFKKVCIADYLAGYANPVFNRALAGHAPDAIGAWLGTLAYTFQIYFDFSGYSDMAFGLALLFGIRLPVNFFSPYKSTCINEFWRRWNITLGRFFRDYLYIPLGGGRSSAPRVAFNVVLVMFLSGLWHGAGWNFVLWGLLHGLGMVVATGWGRGRDRFIPALKQDSAVYRGSCVALTFLFTSLAWVVFRSADMATAAVVYEAMFSLGWQDLAAALAGPDATAFVVLLVVAAIVFFVPNTFTFLGMNREGEIPEGRLGLPVGKVFLAGLLASIAIIVLNNGYSEQFLYFIF